jgi:hypothetical protein
VYDSIVFDKSSLIKRCERHFEQTYKEFFYSSVKNADGARLEGSAIEDSSLNVWIKKEDVGWQIELNYSGNYKRFIADIQWKETVGKENIAVADRKIVTKAELIDASDINSIPCKIYKAKWIKRSQCPSLGRSLVEEDGYVVKLGNEDNPIAIRTTPVLVQAKKIAQNSATKEFFKRLIKSEENQ